jgi:hypothetical protein
MREGIVETRTVILSALRHPWHQQGVALRQTAGRNRLENFLRERSLLSDGLHIDDRSVSGDSERLLEAPTGSCASTVAVNVDGS